MSSLQTVRPDSVIVGYDFSTGGVKALAFDLSGNVVERVKLPTDLWTAGGVMEVNLMQLEGQARAATRALADVLGVRQNQWAACGISATHHTAGRIDRVGNQVRRAIAWDDKSLAPFHDAGLARLGGDGKARELTGGQWAMRYSLSHYVKDEMTLSAEDWRRIKGGSYLRPLMAGQLSDGIAAPARYSAPDVGFRCVVRP